MHTQILPAVLMAAEPAPPYRSIPQAARDEKMPDNLVILCGRLGADPELRPLTNDNHMTRLRLAVNDFGGYHQQKANGEAATTVQWHNLTLFGALARRAADQLRKGSRIQLEGRLIIRRFTKADGSTAVVTEVKVTAFSLLEAKGATEAAA